MKPALFVLLWVLLWLTLTPALGFSQSSSQSSKVPILPTTILGVPAQRASSQFVGSGQFQSGSWSDEWSFAGTKGTSQSQLAGLASGPIFLAPPTYSSTGESARAAALADLNHDGNLDLVIVNQFATDFGEIGTVAVMLGNGDGTFQPSVTYGYNGDQASSVVVADVNGDGKPDIVVGVACASLPSCASGGAAVLLGNGDGTFQPAVTYLSGQYDAGALAVADVNGDGKPDLVLTYYCISSNCGGTDGGVAVLLGNGDGTFQSPVAYDAGGYGATTLAVGDVNGDGKLDLLVGSCSPSGNCQSGGGVWLLLGNGNGTFQRATNVYRAAQPAAMALADVNGDGKLDLLVGACLSSSPNCGIGAVEVLLGKGNGTFRGPITYSSGGQYVSALAVVDVNGDGIPDLVLANECVSAGNCDDGSLAVLLGKGNGNFRAASTYDTAGNTAVSLALGQLTSDGKIDLVAVNQCSTFNDCDSGAASVMLGSGNGAFEAPVTFNPGGYDADSVAAGDLNGDGKLDLVIADECANGCGYSADGSIGVLLGNGDGTFQKTAMYDSGGLGAESVALGDLTGDGKLDMVVANECANIEMGCGPFSTTGSIGVLLNSGKGIFAPAATYAAGAYGTNSVAIADVNGDGKPDLLVANQCIGFGDCSTGSVSILLGNGDGTFQSALTYSSGGSANIYGNPFTSIAVADVNGDGKPDLLVTNQISSDNFQSGSVGVLLGNGDGTFQPVITYDSGGENAYSLAVGDVNGDGKLDVIVANQCVTEGNCEDLTVGSIGVLLGQGDGTFLPASAVVTPGQNNGAIALADLNGDGNLDVASAAAGVLLLGNGDGTFQLPLSLGIFGTGMAVGDFNRDGKPDLAVGGVTILMNISTGFTVPTTTTLASSVNPAKTGQTVVFTAVVSSSRGTPAGKVRFMNGAILLGARTLNHGKATLATSSLPTRLNTITAAYEGSTIAAASVSAPFSQYVVVPTATMLSSTPNPSTRGEQITFTAVVSSSAGAPPDGENVTFVEDLTILGTKALKNGTASLTTSALSTPGAFAITAVYGGDLDFAESASPWMKQTVSLPPQD